MISRNLSEHAGQYFTIKLVIDLRRKRAGNNIDKLSLSLLEVAMLGETKQYQKILSKLNSLEGESEEQVLLHGRTLFAAYLMNDIGTLNRAKKEILKEIIPRDDQAHLLIFALAYLVAVDSNEYRNRISELLHCCDELSTEDASNAIWAYILLLQASAIHYDETTFNTIVAKVNELTGCKSLAESLENCDHPSWGLGIAALAAISLKQHELYATLWDACGKACDIAAKEHSDEYCLGYLAYEMAEVRENELRPKSPSM